jgi:hypothetical protein
MSALVFGLYFEGSTDKAFLPPVIRRITLEVLAHYQRADVWNDIITIPVKPQNHGDLDKKILAAATEALGYHLLIVHGDADDLTADEAREQRFKPGLELVRQAGNGACQDLLPIIPIRAIEAWLMADNDALLSALGINKSASDLGIPHLHKIESTAKPKERLENIIRLVNQSRPRRRPIRRDDLYEPLGEAVRLSKLAHLSAYNQFTADLTEALTNLGVISRIPL